MKKYLFALSWIACLFAAKAQAASCYNPQTKCCAEPTYTIQSSYGNQECYNPQSNSCSETNLCLNSNVGTYVGVFGGANWGHIHKHAEIEHTKFKTGYTGAFFLGYKFNSGIRLEGEVAYRHNQLKYSGHIDDSLHLKAHINTWSYMGNVLYDFNTNSMITPYIGFGLGYARNSAHAHAKSGDINERAKGRSNGFAYQGIVGASLAVAERTDLGLEYRYFRSKQDVTDHSVGLSLKYFF